MVLEILVFSFSSAFATLQVPGPMHMPDFRDKTTPQLEISSYAVRKVSLVVYHGLQDNQVVPLAVNVVIRILWAT